MNDDGAANPGAANTGAANVGGGGDGAAQLSALRALVADGRAELAVSRLRRLLHAEPHLGEAHALLASTLLSLHQPEEALRAADNAVDADPGAAEGHHLRARVLLQLGQHAPALAAAEAAVAREPMVPNYQRALMRAGLAANDLDAAQAGAVALARLAPDQPDGRLGEAEVARRRGKLRRADSLIAELEESHPEHGGVHRLRSAIETDRAGATRPGPLGRLVARFRRRS